MNKIKALFWGLLAMSALVLLPVGANSVVKAEVDVQKEFQSTLNEGGVTSDIPGVPETVSNIINAVLGLIGVATFVLIIYAGGLWLTAAGNEEQVTKAKGLIKNAVFGLVIIFTAYMLVNFVLTQIGGAISVS